LRAVALCDLRTGPNPGSVPAPRLSDPPEMGRFVECPQVP
jgi:hypothetical protein